MGHACACPVLSLDNESLSVIRLLLTTFNLVRKLVRIFGLLPRLNGGNVTQLLI